MTNEIAIHRLLLVRHRKDCTELLAEALDMAITALRKTSCEHNGWIPCSERLPEEFLYCDDGREASEDVLITAYCDADGGYVVDTARTLDTRWYSQTEKMYIPDDWEVLAWMPLPDPYTKDGD